MSDFLESEGYLTEAAAAEALGKTVRTLKNWRQQRIGPAYTIIGPKNADGKRSGQVVYHRGWLLDYLKSNKSLPVKQLPARRKSERAHGAAA